MMKRSTTLRNGQIQSEGMSGKDIEKNAYDQFDNVRIKASLNDKDNVEMMEKKRISHINWQAAPPPQDGSNKPTFKEVFDAEQYKGVFDKLANKSGSRRRRRPSRKYKKSAKRVFRKKSRYTRRR
jgi:hypothetical protein